MSTETMQKPTQLQDHGAANARPLAEPTRGVLARYQSAGLSREVLWHESGLEMTQRLLATLATQLRQGTPAALALNLALEDSYTRTHAPPAQREGWIACALSALCRDLAREALSAGSEHAMAHALMDLRPLLRASRESIAQTLPESAREPLVSAARRVLAEIHEVALATDGVPPVASSLFGHLRHGVSQLRTHETMAAIAQASVLRADRAEHSDTEGAWVRAPQPVREAVVTAALCEGALALARASAREWARTPEASLALARCAVALLGAAATSHTWLLSAHTPEPTGTPTATATARTTHSALASVSPEIVTEAAIASPSPIGTESTMSQQSNPVSPARKAPQLLETLEHDAQDAAWRLAGSQFVKLMRDPLVGLLSRHLAPGDESMRGRIASFLDTELGTSLLSAMLSAALGSLPRAAGPVPDRLARELRVRAMTDAGDVVADLVMGPLRQVMALYLQDPSFVGAIAPSLEAPRAVAQSESVAMASEHTVAR
ncbi:MAG: hypothetical protein Q8Q09_27555 [Deltaproteobacteria bacterium]|nr:hypothetical protein [Deltaproteobacteria bacterium]